MSHFQFGGPFTLKGAVKICYPPEVLAQLFPNYVLGDISDDDNAYDDEKDREIEEEMNRENPSYEEILKI